MIELGADGMQKSDEKDKSSFSPTNVMRGLALMMVPMTMMFPTSLFIHFTVNSLASVVQSLLLRNKQVKNALGIPEIIPPSPEEQRAASIVTAQSKGFSQSPFIKLHEENKQRIKEAQEQQQKIQQEKKKKMSDSDNHDSNIFSSSSSSSSSSKFSRFVSNAADLEKIEMLEKERDKLQQKIDEAKRGGGFGV